MGQGHGPRPLRSILTGASPTGGVYLARHGRTAYNHEGRFQGQQPVPLDELGREQALELAERAAAYDFAALWCSPLLRAPASSHGPTDCLTLAVLDPIPTRTGSHR